MMSPVFSLENTHRQYMNCRRNKRNTINALKFEYRLEENLRSLHDELEGQTYTPSRSVCFVVNQPKLREIFAADFRDRVVHHILVDTLEKVWEPRFIYDSYACRKGKGTHRAVARLQTFMRKVTRNYTRDAYFMHLDIAGFFFHINKEILYQIITKWIRDEKTLWLAGKIIFHDCTKDMVFKGNKDLLKKIPPHKTLFNSENKRGLPIGNLTSQFFANVYLNELDQFVKHRLKSRYYIRYCDDFVLLHEKRDVLLEWKECIQKFLREQLLLELNGSLQNVGMIRNGTDFLGYIVRPDYLLVRRRVVNRLKARLDMYRKILIRDRGHCRFIRYEHVVLEKLRATWASYMAHLKMANACRLRESLLKRFAWLSNFFQEDGQGLMRPGGVPATLSRLKGQYRYFQGRYPGSIIFFQAGRFFEFYDDQAEMAIDVLGLKMMKMTRGFRVRCGFPVRLKERYLERFIRRGFSVYVVKEEEGSLSGINKRCVAEGWLPAPAA